MLKRSSRPTQSVFSSTRILKPTPVEPAAPTNSTQAQSSVAPPLEVEAPVVLAELEFAWSPPLPIFDGGWNPKPDSAWSATMKFAKKWPDQSTHLCRWCLDDLESQGVPYWAKRATFKFGQDISNCKSHLRTHTEKWKVSIFGSTEISKKRAAGDLVFTTQSVRLTSNLSESNTNDQSLSSEQVLTASTPLPAELFTRHAGVHQLGLGLVRLMNHRLRLSIMTNSDFRRSM